MNQLMKYRKTVLVVVILIVILLVFGCLAYANDKITDEKWQSKMQSSDFLKSFELPFFITAGLMLIGIFLLIIRKKTGILLIIVPAAIFFIYCAIKIKK